MCREDAREADVATTKYVYDFAEGNKDLRDLLGGKGANLAEMSNIGLPVPPGFTITTEACMAYYREGGHMPAGLMDDVRAAVQDVEKQMGRTFGARTSVRSPSAGLQPGSQPTEVTSTGSGLKPALPLLVSVRPGAKFSMPGMMDTVLNLGLNPTTIDS